MGFNKYSDLKVLLVEDQSDVRETIRNTLQSIGVSKIFEAESGDIALKMLRSVDGFADMVICDWNMPQTTGLDVLREVRATYPEMPFLMVTGRDDFASVTQARDHGVTAYIRKPFSSTEIEKKLRVIHSRSPAF